jgi:hypothetical protein
MGNNVFSLLTCFSNYQIYLSSICMSAYMNVCMHAYVMHVCIRIPLSKRCNNIDPGSVYVFNFHLRVGLCVCVYACICNVCLCPYPIKQTV